MIADSNSNIAWHRVQLKKNREAVKALEIARFRVGEMTGAAGEAQQKALANLKRKIAESQRCIAAHERCTKRPLATDLRSLAQVSWSSWDAFSVSRQAASRA
jgi:hypothetical protein